MENQVRLTLFQREEMTPGFDWSGKLADAISRLPTVRANIVQVVQLHTNNEWNKIFGEVGYPLKPYTGLLSVYSSDVASLKELISTIIKENDLKDSPEDWMVGYDEVKMKKLRKDPSIPLAKFSGIIVRNRNLTTPQFHSHWSGPHAALFCSLPKPQEKVVIYSQFHSSTEWTEDFAELGLNIAAYEGIVEISFDTMEDMVSIFGSQEHVEHMMPDEAKFVDLLSSGVITGIETLETKKYTSSS